MKKPKFVYTFFVYLLISCISGGYRSSLYGLWIPEYR